MVVAVVAIICITALASVFLVCKYLAAERGVPYFDSAASRVVSQPEPPTWVIRNAPPATHPDPVSEKKEPHESV